MTAALASYEDLIAFDDALLESATEQLGDESLLSLLLLRFRSYVSHGFGVSEALFLAVGYAEADLALVLESTTDAPVVLQ